MFREHAISFLSEAFQAGVFAADPEEAVATHLRVEGDEICFDAKRISLEGIDKIWVVGFGKAAANMARGVERILGDRIDGGVVITKYGHGSSLEKIEVLEAGHPIPDSAGVAATARIIDLVRRAGEQDLVISLVSGGGSSLLVQPKEGITLQDKQAITGLLLRKGVSIERMNSVRKSLSLVKAGQLALLAQPANMVSLIISDIIGDPVESIASGPTVTNTDTTADAIEVLRNSGAWDEMPLRLQQWFEQSGKGVTPHADDCSNVTNIIVANIRRFVAAIEKYAAQRNYGTLVLSTIIHGEAREISHVFGAIAREIRTSRRPISAPACVIAGGETTVNVTGNGLGGRNMEMALAVLPDLVGLGDVVFFSAGTDGTDGPTDAAGAFGFSNSLQRASELCLDPIHYLQNNDSYHFFEKLGDLFKPGPTGTNVMDVQILMVQ